MNVTTRYDDMFHRDFNVLSADQLRDYTSQLEQKERDIRHRAEVRGGKSASHGTRDLVLERLIWLLARVGARRRALSARIAA